jgi:thiopeptide-type bacteriocin biosynthesis protein
MTPTMGRFAFEPRDFFVLRAPLLPIDELLRWSADLQSPAAADDALDTALAGDYTRLTEWLRATVARAEVREALYLASPDLCERLPAWEAKSMRVGDAQRITRALVRYLTRMASRPTPFGLFAGVAVGTIGAETRLEISTHAAQRHVHLDMGYLEALTVRLQQDTAARAKMRYQANTSLSQAAGRLHYVETHHQGAGRVYTLAAVDSAPEVSAVLRRCERPTALEDLAGVLTSEDIQLDEAMAFVNEMIDAQLLVSDIEPALTGSRSLDDLCSRLAPVDVRTARVLSQVAAALHEIEAAPLGVNPETYERVRALLAELAVPDDAAESVFQVDMRLPADVSLGKPVVDEFARATECLFRIGFPESRPLAGFVKAFVERYDLREVPLLEALDEEVGVGLPADEPEPARDRAQAAQQAALTRLLVGALSNGGTEMALTDADVEAIAYRGPTVDLPPGCSVMGALSATDADALRAGEFRLVLEGGAGPSGATLFGRFCHIDPRLAAAVARQLEAEEAAEPAAIHAEVVHLSEGRMGNVLARPALRRYEIPFLGRSGAPADQQLRLDDLLVSVRDGRIVLRSRRLQREVVPHLTTAHNADLPDSPRVYRFLARYQRQHYRYALAWSWGSLSQLPFLPRVTYGRTVLARAQWTMSAREMAPMVRAQGVARIRAVRAWRDQFRLPRFVQLRDGDHALFVDLDNPLCVDVLLNLIQRRPFVTLNELLPAPEEAAVVSAEGRILHEIVVPFARRRSAEPPAASNGHGASHAMTRQRIRQFMPGSEWLYAKLYTGIGVADRVLRDMVAPLVEQAIGSGAAARWFFLRYSDPHPHIRLRFCGDPRRLAMEVLPALTAAATPFIRDGRIWRVQLDTYDREVERYGGPVGVELAESLFTADSTAALAVLRGYGGAAQAERRALLTIAGIDGLLAAFAMGPAERITLLASIAPASPDFHRQQGDAYRRLRPALESVLTGAGTPDLEPGLAALAQRSAEMAPIVAALRAGIAAGTVEGPAETLLLSFTHMFVNRVEAVDPNRAESRYYDFIRRFHVAALARGSERPLPQRGHDDVATALVH